MDGVKEAIGSVSKGAIKKARLKEIRQEILNSQKLKVHAHYYLYRRHENMSGHWPYLPTHIDL